MVGLMVMSSMVMSLGESLGLSWGGKVETQGVLSRIPHARGKDGNHVRGGAVASRRRSAAVLCLRLHEGPGNPRIGTAVDRKTFRTGAQPLKGVDAQPNLEPTTSLEHLLNKKTSARSLRRSTLDQTSNHSKYLHTHSRRAARRVVAMDGPVASSSSPAS